MVNKKLTTMIASILALVLMVSFVSAFSVDLVSPSDDQDTTSTTVDFQFDIDKNLNEDMTSCRVHYDSKLESNSTPIKTSSTNTIQVTGLTQGQSYEWVVECFGLEKTCTLAAPFSCNFETIDFNSDEITLEIFNDAGDTITINEINIDDCGDMTDEITILDGGSEEISIGCGENIDNNFLGDIEVEFTKGDSTLVQTSTGTLLVEESSVNSTTRTLNVNIPVSDHFCTFGETGTSGVTMDVDINNNGDGTDSENDVWYPLDEIEIEVEVENDHDYDFEDVTLELGIYKANSNTNIAEDMIWISDDEEEYDLGDVDEDEKETHTFVFRVNPEEIEDTDYWVKVKAYEDGNEENICIDYSNDLDEYGTSKYYAEIDVSFEDEDDGRAVIVDREELPELTALCGETLRFDADVWNIGDKDQPDRVLINVYNKELGIDDDFAIDKDLDIGEKENIEISLDIPQDADEKTYSLEFMTFFDYDDDDDEYGEESDVHTYPLTVEGNCRVVSQEPTISVNLGSEAQVEEDLILNVQVTNPAEASTYVLSVSNYNSWAELVDGTNQALQLDEEETQTIEVTLKPTESGAQTFNIVLTDLNGNTYTQPVSVSVKERTGLLTGAFSGVGETGLYIVAGIILLLIIIVIVLIVKVASRPTVQEF